MGCVNIMDAVDVFPVQSILFPRPIMPIALLFLFELLFIILAPLASAQPPELKVMTFNIRYAGGESLVDADGWTNITPFSSRKTRVLRIIAENDPDILGLQEPLDSQVKDLRTGLKAYSFYGIGRDDGKIKGEYAAIFYRTERFSLNDSGSFWLSKTPTVPGTTFSTRKDANARIASWVKLTDSKTSQSYCVLNTHLDNQDAQARVLSAELICQQLQLIAPDLPVLVTGDFNATETDRAVITLVGKDASAKPPLLDSYRKLHPVQNPNERTFHDFTGDTKGLRIDFILHSPEFTPIKSEILRTKYGEHYPSDHYPTITIFTISTSQPPPSAQK
jgi:endonuclease/exonuclease/phosphatase family metal-dependent hydrolase